MSLKTLEKSLFAILAVALLLAVGCSKNEAVQKRDIAKDRAVKAKPSSKLAQRIYSAIKEADRFEICKYENEQLAVITRKNKRFAELNRGILLAKDYPDGPNRCGGEFVTIRWFKGDEVVEMLWYKSDKSVSTNRYSKDGVTQALTLSTKTWQLLETIADPSWPSYEVNKP